MRANLLKMLMLLAVVVAAPAVRAQRIIDYAAGMGTRDPNNSDVWILYNRVKAVHEGMTLYSDSASFDTKRNIFKAYRNVKMIVSDTTTLFGDEAVYDGTTRFADVWGDTVRLVDGRTVLVSDRLSYDRNSSTASYFTWGHTTHDSATLDSRKGFYHSDTRDLYLYDDVVLQDTGSLLVTDTLMYNTRTSQATFVSPTHIYSDSSTIYSEQGTYNTSSHHARSFKASRVTNREKVLTADTLYFDDSIEYGEAFGNVVIVDSANNVVCAGRVGITDQKNHYSFVTDSALIIYVDKGDSLFVHADTIFAYNNDDRKFEAAKAYHDVRIFRFDVQCIADSLYYSAADSSVTLFYRPVVWYQKYQCSADTIRCFFNKKGLRLINLRNDVFCIEQVDTLKYSQVKGRNADVYCADSEPLYADVLGSANMVYYVLDEEDTAGRSLLGVNVGVGSDMRIYFEKRKPCRVVTFGEPDMQMFPPDRLPADKKELPGFRWLSNMRPRRPAHVFGH